MTAPPSQPRIAYIAGTFPLPSETFVYREVRALRQRGWFVQAVSLNPPSRDHAAFADLLDGLIVIYGPNTFSTILSTVLEKICHPLQSTRTLFTALGDAFHPGEPMSFSARLKICAQAYVSLGLARQLRKLGIQHIHCHFAHAPASIGMYAAMQLKIPFSFTGHANDLFQRRALLKTKLRRAKFVSCISHWHRDWYRGILPDTRDRDQIIRCGVDVATWKPKTSETSDPFRVFTLCRLVEKKGVDTLIRAVNLLPPLLNRPITLTIAGDGPDRDRLKAIDVSPDINVHWLGSVDHETVPSLLAQADVFALPCRADANGDKDGIPVVLMEAMACGLPAIAGDLPAIRELIEDGVTGLLVNGSDPAALAQRLAKLAQDPALRQSLAAAGRKRVEDEFDMAPNLDRLEKQLNQSIGREIA